MKKLFAAAAAGVLGLICIGAVSASAAELSFTGSISPDGTVTISGYGNPGYVSVELIRGGKEAVVAAYEDRAVADSVLVDAAAVGADGAFTLKWNLPASEAALPAAERSYTAVVANTDDNTALAQRALPLYFAKTGEISEALAAVAAAVKEESVTGLRAALENNADILQITGVLSDKIYVSSAMEVLESVLAQGKAQGFADLDALHGALDAALGVAALNTAEQGSFASVVQKYGEILKLDTAKYSADAALAAAMKRCAASVLREYGLELPAKAPEAFRTVEAVAALNLAARGQVADTLAEYQDIFALDIGALSGTERNTVASKLCVTDAAKAYTTVQAVRKAYQDALKPDGSGSGSGTGTGGSRPSGGKTNVGGGAGLVEVEPADPPAEQDRERFRDLDGVPWAKNYIETLAKAGVINGKREGIFDPESSVTREEFTKMLVLALELPAAETEAGFSDAEEDAWYAPYVNAAAEKGLLQGYDNGTIGIGASITREEAATLIARAADYAGCEIIPAEALTFEDALEISEFAADAVRACQGAKIIQGNDQNQFLPRNPITRAECAKMIFCLMDLL